MEALTLGFILSATGGRLRRECYNIRINDISTDTRTIKKGCLYIALPGKRFDGNDYIDEAFEKGAAAAVALRDASDSGKPVVIVEDTEEALRRLAAAYRMKFDLPIVGVTGSVGKTSTKDAVYAVLSKKYRTQKNEGNLNNLIGMPKSVFGLNLKTEAAVFEMGMSAFGEISRLSRIAKPAAGIITNIGISHIGKLGSQENILKAKLEILDGMKPGSTLILNGDDAMLSKYAEKMRTEESVFKLCVYGINKRKDVFAENIKKGANGTDFDVNYPGGLVRVHMPVPGTHNIYNALAAFCAGFVLDVPPERIAEGLAEYRPSAMRQKMLRAGGVTFIEDCYNASPDSMKAAFEVLADAGALRRVAVIGDMLELGVKSKEAHEAVGKEAAKSGVDVMLCIGKDSEYCLDAFLGAGTGGAGKFCGDMDSLCKELSEQLKKGDTVLFKGSRGMKLEEAVERTYEGWKNK